MQHLAARLRLNPARACQYRHLFRSDPDKEDGNAMSQINMEHLRICYSHLTGPARLLSSRTILRG
ncbi:hypothetical protein SBV1_680007 [Verrucomicrobia bacterium]|nr:hypothetical protein SBV1_680007 [Verrucomicrobiota bacterium]